MRSAEDHCQTPGHVRTCPADVHSNLGWRIHIRAQMKSCSIMVHVYTSYAKRPRDVYNYCYFNGDAVSLVGCARNFPHVDMLPCIFIICYAGIYS